LRRVPRAGELLAPPPAAGGSIARDLFHVTHELAARQDGRFEVTICSLPHPDLPQGTHDRVRYVSVDHAGALVTRLNEELFAEALVRLCRERALAVTIGARVRALVGQHFAWAIQAGLAEYYGGRPCQA
jgi:hypothetical protein